MANRNPETNRETKYGSAVYNKLNAKGYREKQLKVSYDTKNSELILPFNNI